MTITALTNFICAKMQKTDATNVALCKMFVRNRWNIIWDSRLWRDSLIPEMMTVTAGTTLVTIPATIARVVAVRFGPQGFLNPANWESLLRDDPTFYERIGTPCSFIQTGKDDSGQRVIRLVGTPTADTQMLVVGKIPFPACADDDDSPSDYLDGVDAALLAFGEGDMLEKQQQRNAAQLKFKEATAMVSVMDGLQDEQSAQDYTMAATPVELTGTDW